MHGYVPRNAVEFLDAALLRSPVVAILGPRQCGKSTLAREFLKRDHSQKAVYLDLQERRAQNLLREPELLFEQHRQHLIILDEIQRAPEFFSVLRSEIDRERRPGRFLILGSASRDLIQQSSESLAGRIAYLDLTPFIQSEITDYANWQAHWLRGGFPDSLLANDDSASVEWRLDFIRTFLERDIPALGYAIPIRIIERLWQLLAHFHGQIINYSKIAEAADISVVTLKKYISILEQTYMVRTLAPMKTNLKKRLIKSPKIYIRDTGILHTLLEIDDYDHLLAHPCVGPSWKGYAMENIIASMPRWRPSYIRTSNGAEVDLIMERGKRRLMFEFKASKAPRVSRSFFDLKELVSPDGAWVIAPVEQSSVGKPGVKISDLAEFLAEKPQT